MKKIYLTQGMQHGKTMYTGSMDPRTLVHMVDQSIEVGQVQEAQRPLEKKHIQEIADYVGESNGILPTSAVLGTNRSAAPVELTVQTELSITGETLHYMMVPETEEELEAYQGTIDICDGQHRIFSFLDEYRSPALKNNERYEIPVTFFLNPPREERQILFITTNEKQKTPEQNLLMYLKEKLGLLSGADEAYWHLVQHLNSENISPLQGRIILGGEKITKGIKAKQLSKILSKAKIKETVAISSPNADEAKIVEILSNYLSVWENHYGLSFKRPKQDTMTKISGLRYIILLFPSFVEISKDEKKAFNATFIDEMITELELAKGIDTSKKNTLFKNDSDETLALSFRGEGATIKLAEMDGDYLKKYIADKQNDSFDPFA